MYYTKLIKEFNKSQFDNSYLFYGEEQYIIDNLINYLVEQIDPVYRDFNVKFIDWEKKDLSDILANLETLPFMGNHTFTIVTNAEKMNKDLSDEAINNLKKYIQNPNESSVLIFIATHMDKRKKMYKALKKHSRIEEFRKLNIQELKNGLINIFQIMTKKSKVRPLIT